MGQVTTDTDILDVMGYCVSDTHTHTDTHFSPLHYELEMVFERGKPKEPPRLCGI